MVQTLTALAVIGAAIAAAWWFMKRQEEKRASRAQERKAEDLRKRIEGGGSEVGTLWDPADPDPLARKILDDGFAHNSKWVDEDFVRVYHNTLANGGGMDDAFIAAMAARKWRRGSREQVADRMASHLQGFSDADKERWKRTWEQQNIPSGHGVFS